ncbi:3-oxoacyl-[acyl-carrier protein] reductase [Formosa agariphila KMM 3901]|uniref:3-oxoacyl-[acyl-carrier protein] reductase n=1 Tax=Formosa agariphila (strain DSM 15362 / KCTC 12365 / LMG 23005 / KMM 3901 / M-2Alg 35-1) TaxID=1347342 RepID=T2KJZ1_FORAG|nr:3-ketoacyl-ACP reductase [Formosa agariphila]CDF79212.1 3-oxoacyl-[acyl-carrier protein] reductase [Formosa agariphila KMM 3901]
MRSLKGQRALITGGCKGIGKALAIALAKEGVHIALLANSTKEIEEVAVTVRKLGVEVITVTADVSSKEDVDIAAKTIFYQFKTIDILINNAGIAKFGSFMAIEPEEWEHIIKINVMGIYHVTRAFLPDMIANKSGDIVNIASKAGLTGNAATSAYTASKFAVLGLTESLMQEVGKHNIRVSALTPNTIHRNTSENLSFTDLNKSDQQEAEDFSELIIAQLKLNRRILIKKSSIWSANS